MTRNTMKHSAQATLARRVAWPVAGAVTAAATVLAGWAPVTQATPSLDTHDASLKAIDADLGDGTYQSCDAYFGFGKDDGAIDVVSFDVTDQNGSDGVAHAVPDDTEVIFQLTNEDGDTLNCVAPEITEQAWQDAMDSVNLYIPEGKSLPTYPGPGHYAYPSVSYDPYVASNDPDVDDFGYVDAVAFEVVSIPDGHTLVSPTGVTPLVQHFPIGEESQSDIVDPRVLDYIETNASAAASDAFQDALGDCDNGNEFSDDLVAAIQALQTYRGFEDFGDYSCGDVERLNAESSFLLGLDAARSYVEPIVLALPEETTTSTSTSTTTSTPSTTSTTVAVKTTTVVTVPPAAAPKAVAGSPTYTG